MAIAAKDQKATDAQARLLAFLLAGRAAATAGWPIPTDPEAYLDPTSRKLVDYGWIAPNGQKGESNSGQPFERHSITPAGEDALCWWLTKRYQARA